MDWDGKMKCVYYHGLVGQAGSQYYSQCGRKFAGGIHSPGLG